MGFDARTARSQTDAADDALQTAAMQTRAAPAPAALPSEDGVFGVSFAPKLP